MTFEATFCKVLKAFIPDTVISSIPASDFLYEGLMACKLFQRLDSCKAEKLAILRFQYSMTEFSS